jgi:hypothetical protein
MKKYFILFSMLLILFVVGVGSASEESIQVYEANKLINSKIGWNEYAYHRTDRIVKGHSIYLKLIYQEEVKQTKILEKIMKKLNTKESL